jgi:hypothetical protein
MSQHATKHVCIRITHQHLRAAYADAAREVIAHKSSDHVHVAVRKIY